MVTGRSWYGTIIVGGSLWLVDHGCVVGNLLNACVLV